MFKKPKYVANKSKARSYTYIYIHRMAFLETIYVLNVEKIPLVSKSFLKIVFKYRLHLDNDQQSLKDRYK
jgi:hypothetical protein